MDGIRAQDGQLASAELTSMQQFVSPVYLGSAPESFHKELKVNKQTITHCPVHTSIHTNNSFTKCNYLNLNLNVVFIFYFKSKALPKQSVSGCIRNFKMNGAPMLNPATNHGAGPCFEGQTQRGAYFSGNGAHVIISKCNLMILQKHF